MTLIDQARQFAHDAHDSIKQVRKYTGEPYWVHVDDVAKLVERYQVELKEEVICAAYLHDVLEDVAPKNHNYNAYRVYELFGPYVLDLVLQLTDTFTKEDYPEFSREKRKRLECARIARNTPAAKIIKLADLISNSKSIVEHDPEFARIYLMEKWELLPHLKDGLRALWIEAHRTCLDGAAKINLKL